jgi:hypothetical protein
VWCEGLGESNPSRLTVKNPSELYSYVLYSVEADRRIKYKFKNRLKV